MTPRKFVHFYELFPASTKGNFTDLSHKHIVTRTASSVISDIFHYFIIRINLHIGGQKILFINLYVDIQLTEFGVLLCCFIQYFLNQIIVLDPNLKNKEHIITICSCLLHSIEINTKNIGSDTSFWIYLYLNELNVVLPTTNHDVWFEQLTKSLGDETLEHSLVFAHIARHRS